MKKITLWIFLSFFSIIGYSQTNYSYVQADYFYGNILNSEPDATIFLQGHPTGFYASYNIEKYGLKDWEGVFNYPDVGFCFGYQDNKSDILGGIYSISGHYNFYILNRTSVNQLIVRVGAGLSYTTAYYNKETNNKNTALSTPINSNIYFKCYYQRNNIIANLGVTAGLTFVHQSNGNFKSPNSGLNIWAVGAGLNYSLDAKKPPIQFIPTKDTLKVTEPIKLNLAVRGGINESPIIGSGIKPFFVFSAYIDKRISRKSAFQLGSELYVTPSLKDYYEIIQNLPNSDLEEIDSFSRISVLIGYELFINKISIEAQIGYYLKYPFEYDGRVYETLGLKRYFNNKWFAGIRIKAHVANAESVELGFGIRL